MPKLNPAQKAAVEYLEGPLLVLAGPGTGKTQLLSTRVAHILQVTDTAPENILCLTFTENGADNMRERLLSLVGPEAAKIHIGTYHAFGRVVLAEYKNYATTAVRQFDNAIDEVMQYKIVKQIQAGLPARDILRGDQVKDIVDTINNAKSAGLSADDLTQIAEQNQTVSKEINLAIAPILAGLKPRMKFADALAQVYQPLLETLAAFVGKPITGDIEPEANFLVRDLNSLIDTESAKEKPSVSPLTGWVRKNFDRDDEDNYILSNRVANLKLASLARIMRAYDEHLSAHNLYDFADMIMEAIHFLRSDRGFRLTLSERYQYILLDEFQDTNTTQFEIIKLLTDYDSPQVMAVGDDDQAIFEFQGANASNLLEFQNHYHAKLITLTDNYRSSSEILQFSHRVAEQITESFAHKHQINKKLTARGHWADSREKISRHEFISADSEATWIASQIRHLLDHGADPSEIAVIAPKHKYLLPLLPYLRAEHIDIAYEKREDVLQDPRIEELTTLARFCSELASGHNPAHLLLKILSFKFWQLPPLTVVSAVSGHYREPALEILAKSDDPRLQKIAELLAALTTGALTAPLELWLDWAIGTTPLPSTPGQPELRSPFLDYYTHLDTEPDTYSTFSLYENLTSLKSALNQHLQVPQPRLADFIEFLDDYTLAGAGVLNTSPYRDSEHCVQVMTAFKSKGLEFHHVFLTAVDSTAWGRGKGNNNLLALPKNLIQIRHTGGTDDERLRVFFVALTRAKETLTLTNAITDFTGKQPRRLEYLAEAERADDAGHTQVISPFLPAESQVVIEHTDLPAARAHADLQVAWSAAYQQESPELFSFLKDRMQRYRVSATDLTSFIDLIYAGPTVVYLRKVLRSPSEPATTSMILGDLIHAVFEQVTNQHISDEDAFALYRTSLADQPLLDADRAYLAERGEHALKISLATFRDVLRDPEAKGEIDLSPEQPSLGTIPLTGKIDHMSIDPEHRTIEIYDFKTGKFHPEAWHSHPSLYKYQLQLGFYKLLLNHSRSYAGYTVTRGHILFVDPDQDDRVYDKVYEFNPEDEDTLIKLIRSFYRHMTTLDFVQNPDFMREPDKARNMKDIREFVELLTSEVE